MTEINLLSLQNNCTGKCLDFIRDNDFKYYETEEMLKEIGKIEYSPFTYISKVYALKTMDEVVQWYKNFCKALIEAKAKIIEKQNNEEVAQIEKENLKKLKEQEEENQEKLKNFSKETSKNQDTSQETIDRLNREKENYRETAKEEIKKSDTPTNNDDDGWKKKFIGDIEMDLIKKNISQERLSKRLGVSDWKEKINGAAGFHEALSRRSDLWDIISKLEYEYTCASCGVKKEEYTAYGVGSKNVVHENVKTRWKVKIKELIKMMPRK